MTKLLEKAVNAITKLPKRDQDAVASMILDELASETRWAKAFATSHSELSSLAKEASAEYKSGKTKRLLF